MFLFQVYWLDFLKIFFWHVPLRQLWVIQVGWIKVMLWFGSFINDLATTVIQFIGGDQAADFWPYFSLQGRRELNKSFSWILHPPCFGNRRFYQTSWNSMIFFFVSLTWTVCVTHQVKKIVLLLCHSHIAVAYVHIQP